MRCRRLLVSSYAAGRAPHVVPPLRGVRGARVTALPRVLTPTGGTAHVHSAMTLMVRALMQSIADLASSKGIVGRVLCKTNRYGELVIALLIPPRHPGEWDDEKPTREQKKTSRENR